MTSLYFCLTIMVLVVGSLAADNSIDEVAVQEFVTGNHQFTAAVYKELVKGASGNILVSPLSAEIILALANEGANSDTSTELMKGLRLPSTKEKTQQAIKSILPKLRKNEENNKLLTANKVYVADGFEVETPFKETAVNTYKSDTQNLNFAENTKSSGIINQWVEDNTNNKIKNLVKPDSLSADTRLVLVNALYFSANWVNPFEKYATRKDKFYLNDKDTTEVDMMDTTDTFNYYENKELDAKFLEMPYEGGDVTMTIVLPNQKTGLKALEGNIEKVFERPNYTKERVNVRMPRFTVETEIQFIPILKTLGIKKAFSPEADFTGINKKGGLAISEVVQKAFINVTETGTEAAAATAGFVALLSIPAPRPPALPFHVDHSYIYYLSDSKSGLIFFTGKLNSPK